MTKQTHQSSGEDQQDAAGNYTDPTFTDAEMGRVLDTVARGIGKQRYAPYGGARSYTLLPEEVE